MIVFPSLEPTPSLDCSAERSTTENNLVADARRDGDLAWSVDTERRVASVPDHGGVDEDPAVEY